MRISWWVGVFLALCNLLAPQHALAQSPQTRAPYVGRFDYGWIRCDVPVYGYTSNGRALHDGANKTYNDGCGVTVLGESPWPTLKNPQWSAVCGSTNTVPQSYLGRETYNNTGATIQYKFHLTDDPPCGSTATDGLAVLRRRDVACPRGYIPTAKNVCVRTEPAPPPPKCDTCTKPPSPDNSTDPIDTTSGVNLQSHTDIRGGKGLALTRYYSTLPAWFTQTLGVGWRHNFEISLSIVPAATSLGFTTVWAQRPGGALIGFNVATDGSITHDLDVALQLVRQTDSSGNVTGWTIHDESGETETYSANGLIETMTVGKADILTFDYVDSRLDAVIDSNGRSIIFAYDATGRLASATGPDGGSVLYGYDGNDNLATVTYPDATPANPDDNPKLAYKYEDTTYINALTGILDETGRRFASWAYTNGYTNAWGYYPVATMSVHGAPTSKVDRVQLTYADDHDTVTTTLGQVINYTFSYDTRFDRPRFTSADARCGLCTFQSAAQTYDDNGFLASSTDFAGTTTTYEHDPDGLERRRTESANRPETLRTVETDWDSGFRVPTQRRTRDAAGTLVAKTDWTYNDRGQPLTTTLTDPKTGATRTTTTSYCEAADIAAGTCPLLGLVTSVDGPRTDVSDVTTYTYYPTDDSTCASAPTICPHRKGDLWKLTNALNQATTFTKYDGAGRLLSSTDANGVVTDRRYGPRGWLTQIAVRGSNDGTTSDDLITGYSYYANGLLHVATQPDGSSTTYTYDAAHRLTDVADNLGDTIHYTLDSAGHRTHEDTKDPSGALKRSVVRTYNALGQVATTRNADGTTVNGRYTYDADGNPDRYTNGRSYVTDSDYDALNRLSRVAQDPGASPPHVAATTRYAYDALDRLVDVTDPFGLHTQYTFDGLGNQTELDSHDTGTTRFAYDAAGNRTGKTDARGVSTLTHYDALGRITRVDYPTSTLDTTYGYDTVESNCPVAARFPVGHLNRLTDVSGTTQLCYDRFGRLVVKKAGADTVQYAYDAGGRLARVIEPKGTRISYGRDALGRIVRVSYRLAGQTADTTLVSNVTYYPYGPVATITYGNGRTLTRTYDADYVIGSVIDTTAGKTDGLDLSFGRDVMGNLTRVASGSAGNLLGYDALDRLTNVDDLASNPVWTYTYDATGNRLSKQAGTAPAVPYTYSAGPVPPASHRLLAVGETLRDYDAMGNTTAIGGAAQGFVYDDTGRMTRVKAGGQLVKLYQYNALGQRVRKSRTGAPAETVRTVYDEGGHVLGDFDASQQIIDEYVWMDDLPVAVLSGASARLSYIEPDHLGTPRVAIDAASNTRNWSWPLVNDPFGEGQPSGTLSLNLRFPGQVYDGESGLSYNYFRDYDSSTGRYMESDPLGLRAGISTYAYVSGNPLDLVDALGLQESCAANPAACAAAGMGIADAGAGTGAATGGSSLSTGGAVAAGVTTAVVAGTSGDSKQCKKNDCPPCSTVTGKIVPVGTIGYRLDRVPPSKAHWPYPGDHYNLSRANQNPNNCQCFWVPAGATDAENGKPPPVGSIPIEPFMQL